MKRITLKATAADSTRMYLPTRETNLVYKDLSRAISNSYQVLSLKLNKHSASTISEANLIVKELTV